MSEVPYCVQTIKPVIKLSENKLRLVAIVNRLLCDGIAIESVQQPTLLKIDNIQ